MVNSTTILGFFNYWISLSSCKYSSKSWNCTFFLRGICIQRIRRNYFCFSLLWQWNSHPHSSFNFFVLKIFSHSNKKVKLYNFLYLPLIYVNNFFLFVLISFYLQYINLFFCFSVLCFIFPPFFGTWQKSRRNKNSFNILTFFPKIFSALYVEIQ